MTILFEIKGSCRVIGKSFDIQVDNNEYQIHKDQTAFQIVQRIEITDGWNTVYIKHVNHPDDLTRLENGKIVDHSFLAFDQIMINKYEISHSMWQNSGCNVYHHESKNKLYQYHLGEPFVMEIKFYFPVEHWTFALAEGYSHHGRIGWKHA